MSNYVLYLVAAALLGVSYFQDRDRTIKALKKGWKSLTNILPQFLGVIMLVGILMAVVDPVVISSLLGNQSGLLGIILSAVVGAVTLIPAFVAFPTAALLLQGGAGYMQIGAFVSSLMMVGIVTMPLEIQFFGKKVTVLRNLLAFIFSFVVAYIIGKVVGGL